MILALRSECPGVTLLGGRIDTATQPSKSEIVQSWITARLGPIPAEKYAAWDTGLPVLAVSDGGDGGLRFLASRSEPASKTTLEEIGSRRLAAFSDPKSGDTGDGCHALALLQSIFGAQADAALYLVGHEAGEEGSMRPHGSNNLVWVGRQQRLVAALVQPGRRELEVQVVPED
jgi:hypothetical protein